MRRRALAALGAAAGLVASARPALALCANCLGQSSRLGEALRLVGTFLLIPPAIFFAAAIAIGRLQRAASPASAPPSGDRGDGGDQGG